MRKNILLMMMNEGKSKPRRNQPPTNNKRYSSAPSSNRYPMKQPNKQCHHYCLMSLLPVFWLTVLLWCERKAVANGLPLGGENDVIPLDSINYGINDRLFSKGGKLLAQGESSQDGNIEEPTGLYRMSSLRSKKGLSYLSKYYTTAHNNINLSGGNSGESIHANKLFGIGYGSGGRGSNTSTRYSSSELHFPSSVRRKLSFYPPISHSTFMSPWSSRFTGRPTTMRLRWGK